MGRRSLLLINRKSRSGHRFYAEAIESLKQLGFEVVEPGPGLLPEQAIQQHASEVDLIIVGGGDGSLNSVADALTTSNKSLGILPLGTANDLARTLNIPNDLNDACRVIAEGHTRQIDLGRVNGKPFFNVASIGLSVAVTRRLSQQSKGWLGVMAYLVSAMQAVTTRSPFRVEIQADGKKYRRRTLQITVGNGRHYGGGMTVEESAAPDDNQLDLYSLEVPHWLGLIPLLPALRFGTLKGREEVLVLHGRKFEVHTVRPRSVSADGEIITRTPATFTVQPRAITVFVPREAEVGSSPSRLST